MKSLRSFGMSAMPSQATRYHVPEDLDLALYNPAAPYNSPHQTLLLMCSTELVAGNECARYIAAYHPGCSAAAG